MLQLSALRKEKKISQQKLALDLNVSQATISKYEKGAAEPDISTLCALANYFHVTVDFLVGRTNRKYDPPASPLSEKEQKLLHHFNSLSDHQKEKVEIYILGLLDI